MKPGCISIPFTVRNATMKTYRIRNQRFHCAICVHFQQILTASFVFQWKILMKKVKILRFGFILIFAMLFFWAASWALQCCRKKLKKALHIRPVSPRLHCRQLSFFQTLLTSFWLSFFSILFLAEKLPFYHKDNFFRIFLVIFHCLWSFCSGVSSKKAFEKQESSLLDRLRKQILPKAGMCSCFSKCECNASVWIRSCRWFH